MASFSFPPIFETADEHLAFYMQVPVGERILSNARFAYADMMQSDWSEWSDLRDAEHNLSIAQSEKYRNEHRALEKELGPAWRSKKLERDREEWVAAQGDRDLELLSEETEMIVRAAQARRKSGYLTDADMEKVDNTQIVISGQGSTERTMTVKQIAELYQTSRWINDAVMDTDLRVARAMERLAAR
ncbi:hypothetical protein [Leucobacter luti]|nr:hypothetical protein [Leucobacter luti]